MRRRVRANVVLMVVLLAGVVLILARRDLRKLWWDLLPERPFRVVVIDAGHGGADPGAVAGGMFEKDIVLDLAHRVRDQLVARGFRVVMTRHDDSFLALAERVAVANRSGNCVFLSLHLNTEATGTAQGVETFFHLSPSAPAPRIGAVAPAADAGLPAHPWQPPSEQLARAIQSALAASSKSRDRGVKSRDFHLLRHANVPAVLIEAGFLSHPDEARLLTSPAYLDLLAAAIADGIGNFHTAEEERIGRLSPPTPHTQG